MAKHTAYDLKQMQSLPLEAKIIMTKQRSKEGLGLGKVLDYIGVDYSDHPTEKGGDEG